MLKIKETITMDWEEIDNFIEMSIAIKLCQDCKEKGTKVLLCRKHTKEMKKALKEL